MKKASNYAFIGMKPSQDMRSVPAAQLYGGITRPPLEGDLNFFVLAFDGTKEAEKNLAGGDPYPCKKCGSILNRFSTVISAEQVVDKEHELKGNESLWVCEFCNHVNKLLIEKEEIPTKEDVVYVLESALEQGGTENDSTIIFCIDLSGSMNSTSEIAGKVELKFGLCQEEIEMLKQFMEPGDEAQFNFLPGAHNKDKTFISRKQCVLSAIESQIQEIKKKDPLKKVGFVLFNNEVTIVGDAKADTLHLVGDKLQNVATIVGALAPFQLTTPLG